MKIKSVFMLLLKKEQWYLLAYGITSIFTTTLEISGIALLMLFLTLTTKTSALEDSYFLSVLFDFYKRLGFNDDFFSFFLGFAIILFFIFRTIILVIYNKKISFFIWEINHRISREIISRFIYMPYEHFLEKNSAELAKTVQMEITNFTLLLRQGMTVFAEGLVLLGMTGVMIYSSWQIFLVVLLIAVINIFFLGKNLFLISKHEGKKRSRYQVDILKRINEFFGNFKINKIAADYKLLIDSFSNFDKGYATSRAQVEFLSILPSLLIQFFLFIAIVIIVLVALAVFDNTHKMLQTLTLFALSLYRTAPSLGKILSGMQQIVYYDKSIELIYKDYFAETEKVGSSSIDFRSEIELKNISYSYNSNRFVLNNISLRINQGDIVGIIGESGGGKTTLVDIICGLLKIPKGKILIDGEPLTYDNIVSWRRKIGYIPQNVYLIDGTVEDNVVLNRTSIKENVDTALKKAHIFDFLQTKEGLKTYVGEGGVKLSGGQKQRIAIARAIYHDPQILILDEATSALDAQTEEKIMKEIISIRGNKTLIIIAHRLNTLRECNKIIKVSDTKAEYISLNEIN